MSGKSITSISVPTTPTKDSILNIRPSTECAGSSSLLSRTLIQTSTPTSPFRSSRCNVSKLTSFTIGRIVVIWIRLVATTCATRS